MRSHRWLLLCFSISFSLGLTALSGCVKHKDGFCRTNTDCGSASMMCDPLTMGCVPVDGAASLPDVAPDVAIQPDGGAGADADAAVDADTAKSCADAACPNGMNCNPTTQKCFSCKNKNECSGKTAACDTVTGLCVACTSDEHCGDAGVCDQRDGGTRFTCVGCTASANVDAGASSQSSGQCNGAAPVCDDRAGPTVNTCIECKQSSQCHDVAKPICDSKTNTCVRCFKDAECTTGPGLCLPNGQCATNEQVIFVSQQAPADCQADGGTGGDGSSPSKAYCSAKQVMDALSELRNVIVVLPGKGKAPLPGLKLTGLQGSTSTIFVLGRNGGSIRGGGTDDAGLDISNATVFIQDLTVEGSQYLGVLVRDGGLVMDRCLIKGNTGGVQIVNSSFDIENTIFEKNKNTQDGTAGNANWSELRITSLAANGPAALVNDTFISNLQTALSFNTKSKPSVVVGLLMASDDPIAIANAGVDLCCSGTATALGLASDYTLGATSPCLDKVPASMSAPDDYLGNKRPGGTSSDCGAVELLPAATSSN